MAQQIDDCGTPIPVLCEKFGEIPSSYIINVPTTTASFFVNNFNNSNVLLNSTLTVNTNFEINNSLIRCGANGKIVVTTGGSLTSSSSQYFGCPSWQGMVVEGKSKLRFSNNSVQNAQTGISILSGSADIYLGGNEFAYNNTCISVFNVATNAYVIGNTFYGVSPDGVGSPSSIGVRAVRASINIGASHVAGSSGINKFHSLSTGISAEKAYVNTYACDFRCNSRSAIESVFGKLLVGDAFAGGGIEFSSLFTSNREDINSSGSLLDVKSAQFYNSSTFNIRSRNNKLGQKISLLNNSLHVTGDLNNPISKTSIYLERSSGANNLNVNNVLEGNHISIDAFGETSRYGIKIIGSSGTNDYMRLYHNLVSLQAGGSPSGSNYSSCYDLSIGAAKNYVFRANNVATFNNNYPVHNNRWGFFLHDWAPPSAGNVLLLNNVLGSVNSYDAGCCAFHFERSGPWSICNNSADQTLRGFHVMDFCSPSVFGLNKMGEHHRVTVGSYSTGQTAGLLIDTGASLGDQFCTQNYWQNLDYAPDYGAWHKSAGVGASEFFVDFSNDHYFPNPILAPFGANWFNNSPAGCNNPINYDCSEPMTLSLNETDELIMEANQTYEVAKTVMEWENRIMVLRKLLEEPSWLTASTETEAFFFTQIEESEGRFALFEKEFHEAKILSFADDEALSALQSKLDELTIDVEELSTEEGITEAFLEQRTEIALEMEQVVNTLNNATSDISERKKSLVQALKVNVQGLPEETIFEAYQKKLNMLRLKQYLEEQFTNDEIHDLEAIADACPQEVGTLRFQAMRLLPLGNPHISHVDQPTPNNCISSERRAEKTTSVLNEQNDVRIFPNPVSEILNIGSPKELQKVDIFDVTGHLVKSIRMTGRKNSINISTLAQGFYVVKIIPVDGIISVSTFIKN